MHKPKKLILDYSKWRCGGDGENKIGEGHTELLNKYGFACCLGQFGLQLGLFEDDIYGKEEPCECKTDIPLFVEDDGVFVMQAIGINDDPYTDPDVKIFAISDLLKAKGIELEVINKP
jgi:hypothetical protein